MSQEKLNHVVTGVLFDFIGFLTSRKERIVLSSSDDAVPAVEALRAFLYEKNIEDADPLDQWEDRCSKIEDKEDKKIDKVPYGYYTDGTLY